MDREVTRKKKEAKMYLFALDNLYESNYYELILEESSS